MRQRRTTKGKGSGPGAIVRTPGQQRARPATGKLPAGKTTARRWPRRWAALVRWFVVRPVRLWWTQGWLGRQYGRWFQRPPSLPEQGSREMQQR